MKNYIIYADSACDIKPEMLAEWGVVYSSLTFRFTDDNKEYTDKDMPIKEFYDKMRAGAVAKTAAVNVDTFADAFRKELAAGNDVLYLGFSSGLSTTFNSARLAAEQLREEFPDSKIIVVDTLAASAGYGLLLKLVVDKKAGGATIDEAAEYAEGIKMNICHWFTVDDLVYLKRGGRISAAAAFIGNAIGLKPVLHVDNEGHLVSVSKVRGRKTAVNALAEKFSELAEDTAGGKIYISNADCMADVEYLNKTFKEKYGNEIEVITDVGPVIGAHAGPGTLALFFVGKER